MNARAAAQIMRSRPNRAAHLGALKFLSVGRTDVGRVRQLNEDAFLDRPDIGLWAVADGMGGHEGGEVASRLVVDALAKVSAFSSAYAFRSAVTLALTEANETLVDRAARQRSGTSGATVAALLAYQGHYACLWAGDSRIYLYRGGELSQLTRDHSVVQELVDAGELRREEARGHRASHMITRAVGAADVLKLEDTHGPLLPGDRMLLCSDGLTGMLSDREIAELLARPPLEAALDKMIDRALARGAPDNVTCILVGAERA